MNNFYENLRSTLPGVFIGLGLFYSLGSIAQNPSKIDSLKTVYLQADTDSTVILAGIKLTREMDIQGESREKVFEYARETVNRALRLNDTLLYARSLDNLGLLFRFHKNYGEAYELHSKAFHLIENKKTPIKQKMIYANNAGVAARYNQKYDRAINFYMKALKIAEEENEYRDIAIANNGIGNALAHLPSRREEAVEYFKRALEAEKMIDNSLGKAMNFLSLSEYYIKEKEFHKARNYLKKLHTINRERQDDFGLALTAQFYGIAYLEEGKELNKAEAYFQKALQRFTDLDIIKNKVEVLIRLGDLKGRQNQMDKAKEYYFQALEISNKIDNLELLKKGSLRLAKAMEETGNYSQALRYYEQGVDYKDSINIVNQNIEIEALTQKYKLSKKENEIDLLQKGLALQKSSLENQNHQLRTRRLFLILLGTGFILLLIIFLLQYRNYKLKKRSNARITKEEKEKMNAVYERNLARTETMVTRLRINPHFLFNSLNAITYLVQSEQNTAAIKYLKVFSRYSRMVLETSNKYVIPLKEELKLARYYLILEENRFERNFNFEIVGEDHPDIEQIEIPPMLLQPFLENAIWHGLLPSKKEELIIRIILRFHNENLQIILDDNGVGRKASKSKWNEKSHKSMGMGIINQRIDLFNKYFEKNLSYSMIDKVDAEGAPEGTRIVINLQLEGQGQIKATL